MLLWKRLLNELRNSSKSEGSASFLIVIWNAAGQVAGCRKQNEREKSKSSPNLQGWTAAILDAEFGTRAIFSKA